MQSKAISAIAAVVIVVIACGILMFAGNIFNTELTPQIAPDTIKSTGTQATQLPYPPEALKESLTTTLDQSAENAPIVDRGEDTEYDLAPATETELRNAHGPELSEERIIRIHGSLTSWELHKLEASDKSAFPRWLDEQFEIGLNETMLIAENAAMMETFLTEAKSQGFPTSPIVACSAMLCKLTFDSASELRGLTKLIGEDKVALPSAVAGLHGLRRSDNGEITIFAPLKGIVPIPN